MKYLSAVTVSDLTVKNINGVISPETMEIILLSDELKIKELSLIKFYADWLALTGSTNKFFALLRTSLLDSAEKTIVLSKYSYIFPKNSFESEKIHNNRSFQ